MRTGMMRVAEVSHSAIVHNVQTVAERANAQVIAVVKANGYGHGAEIVARAALAGGAVMLAVADLEEALALREQGALDNKAPILCWLHGRDADFTAAVENSITLAISHMEQLESLAASIVALRSGGFFSAADTATAVPVHIKLDTGLSRNGAGADEREKLFIRAHEFESLGIISVQGIFTHLANAGKSADNAQADEFDKAVAQAHACGLKPQMLHIAASAAALGDNERLLRYNTVRVGVACYGLSPFANRTSSQLGLKPALRLQAEIIALRKVAAGTGVSYGYNYRAQTDTILALVPVGYADGMPRALNNSGAVVQVAGSVRKIVGRIGMDQCVIDLGLELGSQVSLGDMVVLFGDPERAEPPVEMWADRLHTINYEVIARLGSRLHRVAVS